MTLPDRAAHYFGYQRDELRAVVFLPPEDCLLVATSKYDSGRTLVMHYSERYGKKSGTFMRLTARQRDRLVEAMA